VRGEQPVNYCVAAAHSIAAPDTSSNPSINTRNRSAGNFTTTRFARIVPAIGDDPLISPRINASNGSAPSVRNVIYLVT